MLHDHPEELILGGISESFDNPSRDAAIRE